MKRVLVSALMALSLASSVVATTLPGEKTYDKLFRNGTLDDISRDAQLIYDRKVTNALKPEAGKRDTGTIAVSFREDASDEALLEFRQNGKQRPLGSFPASVGNPMIMYFYESVVRDMAETAGGSPFYIRNRVKEVLVKPSDVQYGNTELNGRTVETQTIWLYPFKDDPNAARMRGFGDLVLKVTMSEDVPGWYVSLVAEASEGEVYRSELTFDRLANSP